MKIELLKNDSCYHDHVRIEEFSSNTTSPDSEYEPKAISQKIHQKSHIHELEKYNKIDQENEMNPSKVKSMNPTNKSQEFLFSHHSMHIGSFLLFGNNKIK
mmetsp:Transcript_19523/g.21834  ORF Transcript_19523/g.21834 Transcript_19523/m.21834 type:complete len:101 (-) Transcript_19523:99-401(-)